MIKPLEWSETKNPNSDCNYSHVTAQTPFGRILISWKGWKENDSPTVDESPWHDLQDENCPFIVGIDVEETKALAEAEYQKRVNECLAT